MDDDDHNMYGLHSSVDYTDKALMMSPENLMLPQDYNNLLSSTGFRERMLPVFGSDELISAAPEFQRVNSVDHHYHHHGAGGSGYPAAQEDDMFSVIKTKIASHPSYPRLLEAYIDIQKVGAPPEIASLLDEIVRGNNICKRDAVTTTYIGADPELDEFMRTYCDMLVKYKSDLARPFDEATTFLNKIEMQLANLCKGSSIRSLSDDGAVSSDEEISGGEVEVPEAPQRNEDQDLKARLMNRFGGHISSLKLEFSKKKKKGKLPREARQTLLDWWNAHYKWPYPTEADKVALAESTGLDQKQINNWFINQRKRHWKPSDSMQFGSFENNTGQFYMDD